MPITQTGRLLQFSCTGLDPDALLIQSVNGIEGLSRLFDFTIELLLPQGSNPISAADILGKNATVTIQPLGTDDPRWINGIIASVQQNWTYTDFDVYTVRLVPALWRATLNIDCRCLQNMAPMDVIKHVLEPYSLSLSDKTTSSSPDGKPLTQSDYVTQYNESDFDFISRIAEQHGIFYWFDHSDSGKHSLTFANSRDGYAGDSFPVEFSSQESDQEVMYRPIVTDFRLTDVMIPGKHTRRDYEWRGHKVFEVSSINSTQPGPGGKNAFEHYTFPAAGAPQLKSLEKQLVSDAGADASLEGQRNATDVNSKLFHGASTSRALYPACTLSLDHPRSDWKTDFLITEIVHTAQQVPPYQSDASGMHGGYRNQFQAIESTRVYAPEAHTPRPRVPGLQSAIVVASAGEDMSVDKNGRVCVQFLWNRDAKADTLDNTWLRVAQQWAGSGWGTYFWPRKNDEVLVAFFNGDPDDPIIVGSAYNGVNVPKYGPADYSTRCGILTRSALNGSGANANELWFEDKKGSEEIHINAEKDMNTVVENCNTRTVGSNETIDVSGTRSVHVKKSQTTNIDEANTTVIGKDSNYTVGGTHKHKFSSDTHISYNGVLNEKVAGNYSLQAQMSLNQKIGEVFNVDAGQEVHLKGGTTVVIESGVGLTIKAGSNFITINPAGIQIQGTMVLINSGGAALPGSPVVVVDPQEP